jgi:hypothetical protein
MTINNKIFKNVFMPSNNVAAPTAWYGQTLLLQNFQYELLSKYVTACTYNTVLEMDI